MPLSSYQPGSKAIFYYAPETAPYPGGMTVYTTTNPAIPSSPSWGGWVDVPQVDVDEGSKEEYGLGSDEPQTIIPGGRIVTVDVSHRVANIGYLKNCMKGSGGFRNIADICLYTGLSDIDSDGFTRVIRYAKANTVNFSFVKGSGQEIMAQTQMMALTEYAHTTLFTPTNTQFGSVGAPLTWHNLTEVNIASLNIRDIADRITVGINHNLEVKNFRPDSGTGWGPTNPWSRTPIALMPRRRAYTVSFQFEDPDARTWVLNKTRDQLNSFTQSSACSLVTTNAGGSSEGSYTNGFILAAGAGRLSRFTANGGDSANELMSSINLLVTGVTLTGTGSSA